VGWNKFILKLIVALGVLGSVLWFFVGNDASWLSMSGKERLLKLALIVVGGSISYFATLALLGFRLNDFRRRG
jgi:putative peptidoglycan lipid II flippase